MTPLPDLVIRSLDCSIDGNLYTLFVAMVNASLSAPTVIGTLTLKDDTEFAEIARLFVREDCRGQGVATKLISEAVARARDTSCTAISLNMEYNPKDTGRREFYQKLGFEAVLQFPDKSIQFCKHL